MNARGQHHQAAGTSNRHHPEDRKTHGGDGKAGHGPWHVNAG